MNDLCHVVLDLENKYARGHDIAVCGAVVTNFASTTLWLFYTGYTPEQDEGSVFKVEPKSCPKCWGQVCRNCGLFRDLHVNGKCLFGATAYAPQENDPRRSHGVAGSVPHP